MATPTLIRPAQPTPSTSTAPPAPTSPTSTDVPPAPADLLRRAAEGDADAWAAIVVRYTPMLRGRVRRYRHLQLPAHR